MPEFKNKKIEQYWNRFINFDWNIFFIVLFFSLSAVAITYKLYQWQIVKGDEYRKKVFNYSAGSSIADQSFDRGKIFFKDGQDYIPVAIQKNGYILSVDNIKNKFLRNNKDIENVYLELSKIIKLDKKDFFRKVVKKNRFIKIKDRINFNEYQKIKKIGIKGLSLSRTSWRYYPVNEIGGKLVGFLDSNKNGVGGLEKYYNSILKRDFKKRKRNIFYDIFSKNFEYFLNKKEVKREGDLYTTIDINVQKYLEDKIMKITNEFGSKDSLGIIIKPASGEIIAMTDSRPINFNQDKKDYRNKMIEFRYEPGSIIKPLVTAIALDSSAINKNFSYYDSGCIQIQKYKICNYDKRARGPNIGLVQIIKESLNLGMVKLSSRISKSEFLNYFLKFGFDEESGVDLPNEVSPNISSLNYKIPINYATASFGQGISMTPISMIRGLSILANDGYLIKPHIVKEIQYNSDIPIRETGSNKKNVLDLETSDAIRKIMVRAVDQSKSKSKYRRVGYSVGAKTGTAQVALKSGKGYKKGVNIHAFFGFFPANAKPEDRYGILLYTFEPYAKYSSQTLTKPFFDIMDYLISYYKIEPDRIK